MDRMILNETSYFGYGCREKIIDEMKNKGYKKALVVTDEGIIKFGVYDKVQNVLDNGAVAYDVFSNIKPNPTVDNVLEGLDRAKAVSPDVLIAVGGGSVMDTAKAIGIIYTNPEFCDVVSLNGVADTKNRCLPIIALPTTAGTAAEVTINYVITDTKNKKKMVCVDPHDIPVVAIIDAELMESMPKSITASTGMDALTHAIECLITKGATTMTDMFAIEAIKTIVKYLPLAVENGHDKVAREKMAYGQYVAGMGFSNAGLGIVHSMAHPLGGRFDIAHGVANAMLLPTVMEYNSHSNSITKYRYIAEAFGIDTLGMTDEQCAVSACEAVDKLKDTVGIPKHLKDLGIKESDLKVLSVDAMNDVCTGGNPRTPTVEDIEKLYKKVL